MPINYGLYNSINTATFATAAQLDFCGIQKMVDAVGLHSGLDGAPINMHQLGNLLGAIGVAPLHLANAFATFANDGRTATPSPFWRSTMSRAASSRPRHTECRDAVKPEWPGASTRSCRTCYMGSGVWIKPKIHTRCPRLPRPAPRTTTAPPGLWATPSAWPRRPSLGMPGGPETPRPERHHQRDVLPPLDGYMIAGPQWVNYMLKAAPLYPANPFPPPPAP